MMATETGICAEITPGTRQTSIDVIRGIRESTNCVLHNPNRRSLRMKLISSLFVLFAVSFGVLGQEVSESGARSVRWCVPYDQPPAFAGLCTDALAVANTDEVQFECVPGGSSETVNT